jgi:hypothetical protein
MLYLQVFADHASSQKPIAFPRKWIDDQKTRKSYFGATRTVYFGTSIKGIYKGISLISSGLVAR